MLTNMQKMNMKLPRIQCFRDFFPCVFTRKARINLFVISVRRRAECGLWRNRKRKCFASVEIKHYIRVYFNIIMQIKPTKEEQILIRITGKDRPGLTASAMEILSRYGAKVLDIGQADIHSTLSLGILIRIDDVSAGQVMKELLFKASELNVQIGFDPVTDDEYEAWVNQQGKNRYILTLIGRSLPARQIAAAAKVIAAQGLNIDSILRLTGRMSIVHPQRNVRACIEF